MYRRIAPSSSPAVSEDCNIPSTVEEIFMDYIGRRVGFFRAFFRDPKRLYFSCGPEKGFICLYARPNGSWELSYPTMERPPKLPEPELGMNFVRDWFFFDDWLAFVSIYCDSWLLSIVSFFSARLSRDDRNCLFDMINDLPTLYGEVTKYHPNRQSMHRGSKSRDGTN